jgi:hypothetical protein
MGIRPWLLRWTLGSRLISDGAWVTAYADEADAAAGTPPEECPLEVWKADGRLSASEPDYALVPGPRTDRVREWTLKSSDGASSLTYFQDTASGAWVLSKIGVRNDRRKGGVGTEMASLVFHLTPDVAEWNLRLTTPDGYAFAATLETRFAGAVAFTRNGLLWGGTAG